jgi:hypothetical protein
LKIAYAKSGQKLEFEDSDGNYTTYEQLSAMVGKQQINEQDFDIIAAMFRLHNKLPALETVLFSQGFILPSNEKTFGDNEKAVWIYEKQGESKRTLTYEHDSHDTMWNRSDFFSFTNTYEAGEVLAKDEYVHSENDYGRIVETRKNRLVKLRDKVLLNEAQKWDT